MASIKMTVAEFTAYSHKQCQNVAAADGTFTPEQSAKAKEWQTKNENKTSWVSGRVFMKFRKSAEGKKGGTLVVTIAGAQHQVFVETEAQAPKGNTAALTFVKKGTWSTFGGDYYLAQEDGYRYKGEGSSVTLEEAQVFTEEAKASLYTAQALAASKSAAAQNANA